MKRINLWLARLLIPIFAADCHQAFIPVFYRHETHSYAKKTKNQSIEPIILSTRAFCTSRKDDAVTTSYLSPNDSDEITSSLENDHKDGDYQQQLSPLPLTNAILRISFDGSRFTGWSAANGKNDISLQKRRKRNRRRRGVEEPYESKLPAGLSDRLKQF